MDKIKITSYRDLDVYNRSYRACLLVMKEIVPKLPSREKYDLADQLSRSSKAIPRLISEGYAKKHQKMGFQKYLDDAMAEANETSVSLTQCSDIYPDFTDQDLCRSLINEYDIVGKQLYRLRNSWRNFSENKKLINKPVSGPND